MGSHHQSSPQQTTTTTAMFRTSYLLLVCLVCVSLSYSYSPSDPSSIPRNVFTFSPLEKKVYSQQGHSRRDQRRGEEKTMKIRPKQKPLSEDDLTCVMCAQKLS